MERLLIAYALIAGMIAIAVALVAYRRHHSRDRTYRRREAREREGHQIRMKERKGDAERRDKLKLEKLPDAEG